MGRYQTEGGNGPVGRRARPSAARTFSCVPDLWIDVDRVIGMVPSRREVPAAARAGLLDVRLELFLGCWVGLVCDRAGSRCQGRQPTGRETVEPVRSAPTVPTQPACRTWWGICWSGGLLGGRLRPPCVARQCLGRRCGVPAFRRAQAEPRRLTDLLVRFSPRPAGHPRSPEIE